MSRVATAASYRGYCRARIERRLRRRLGHWLALAGDAPFEGLRVLDDGELSHSHFVGLRKQDSELLVSVNCGLIIQEARLVDVLSRRPLAIIHPFLRAHATQALCDVSDGGGPRAGIVCYSSVDRESILVPDHEFYFSRGFARYRAAADAGRKSWNARTGTIVWRGSTTGRGRKADDEMTADDAELSLRTRVCLTLRGVPGTDVRFARIVQSRAPEADKLRLQRAGVFGEVIEPTAWLSHRFALDIDGNSNTWSNFFTRLLAGCCVIKVASPLGYRQWYYDALKPWEHFVPVEADLSDLLEKIDWCRANDRACAEIAAAGRAFAMRRDFDTEMALAVDTLNARLTP